MPSTTAGGMPFPTDDDPIADIALAVQNLASMFACGEWANLATNASGDLLIPHNLSPAPRAAYVGGRNTSSYWNVVAITSTHIQARYYAPGGAVRANAASWGHWIAVR